MNIFLLLVLAFFSFIFQLFLLFRINFWLRKPNPKKILYVGFFHPYCNSGGGGERVLWQCVKQLIESRINLNCIIYTGDIGATPSIILQRAEERFNISGLRDNQNKITFVYIRYRSWLEAKSYPRFTMLGQSIGSIFVAIEALCRYPSHIWLDSTGFAFTFPIARFLGCTVCCYVHYPTISTDMLARVQERRPTYNNDERISSNATASSAKILYYKIFAKMYGFVGWFSTVNMVNSSWTANHIKQLWFGASKRTHVVYPSCDTSSLQDIPLDKARMNLVISVGQFRPEKDHKLQLNLFALFLEKYNKPGREKLPGDPPILTMIGGCRDEGDQKRVQHLREHAEKLGISDNVEFKVNVPWSELKEYLGNALVGLHTMWNEHFGIGVVEFMAAGVIPIAHDSGGPKADIVVPHNGSETGFRAKSAQEYADILDRIFQVEFLNSDSKKEMRLNARDKAISFSDEAFARSFQNLFLILLDNQYPTIKAYPQRRQ